MGIRFIAYSYECNDDYINRANGFQYFSAEKYAKIYDNITDDVEKVLARRNDCDHGEMLYYADGYVTAWFMYYLKGDTEAGNAFFGENAEINSNPLYQDVLVHQ